MRAELAAVKAVLMALSRPVHDTTFDGEPVAADFPYYLLWGPGTGNASEERSVTGSTADIDDLVGVTTSGLTADSVRIAAARARSALCPNGLPRSLTVTGRVVTIVPFESRPVQKDADVTLTNGAHPLYAVDLYRMVSVPA